MSSFLPLLRNELAKAARRKLPWFGLGMLGLLCGVIFFIIGEFNNSTTANAWGYVGFSMQMIFTDLGPIFIIVFSALLLAEETAAGTIRASLAAPVHRWEFYLAKAVTGLIYALVLSGAALLLSAALAGIHYRFGAISDAAGVVYPFSQALQTVLCGYALVCLPLTALAMCGLFISTVVRSAGAAVAVGISAFFIIEFTKHLAGLDPYIFTRYMTVPWLTVQQMAQGMDFHWGAEAGRLVELSGLSAVVAFGAGLIFFVRQDLNH